MDKRVMVIGSFILFLTTLIASSALITYTDLFITVKDISDNIIVPNQPVELIFTNVNTGGSINLTEFTNNQGTFVYRLSIGNWKLVLRQDDASTPEIDYSAERTFLIEENNPESAETIYLSPVGTIEGSIVNPEGKLISDADVTFKCKSYEVSIISDKYGSFKQELLPAGQCKVQAAFGDYVGSSMVNVSQGQLTGTVVHLNKTLFSTTKKYVYVILALAILAGLIMISQRIIKKKAKTVNPTKKKKKKQNKKETKKELKKEDENEEELNPRARDIIKTLNERERKTIEFLLIQESNKSTQATIRNNTGIPKTSLARVFQSLESKKVIHIESVGKLKKIELTEWFLGKE